MIVCHGGDGSVGGSDGGSGGGSGGGDEWVESMYLNLTPQLNSGQ